MIYLMKLKEINIKSNNYINKVKKSTKKNVRKKFVANC